MKRLVLCGIITALASNLGHICATEKGPLPFPDATEELKRLQIEQRVADEAAWETFRKDSVLPRLNLQKLLTYAHEQLENWQSIFDSENLENLQNMLSNCDRTIRILTNVTKNVYFSEEDRKPVVKLLNDFNLFSQQLAAKVTAGLKATPSASSSTSRVAETQEQLKAARTATGPVEEKAKTNAAAKQAATKEEKFRTLVEKMKSEIAREESLLKGKSLNQDDLVTIKGANADAYIAIKNFVKKNPRTLSPEQRTTLKSLETSLTKIYEEQIATTFEVPSLTEPAKEAAPSSSPSSSSASSAVVPTAVEKEDVERVKEESAAALNKISEEADVDVKFSPDMSLQDLQEKAKALMARIHPDKHLGQEAAFTNFIANARAAVSLWQNVLIEHQERAEVTTALKAAPSASTERPLAKLRLPSSLSSSALEPARPAAAAIEAEKKAAVKSEKATCEKLCEEYKETVDECLKLDVKTSPDARKAWNKYNKLYLSISRTCSYDEKEKCLFYRDNEIKPWQKSAGEKFLPKSSTAASSASSAGGPVTEAQVRAVIAMREEAEREKSAEAAPSASAQSAPTDKEKLDAFFDKDRIKMLRMKPSGAKALNIQLDYAIENINRLKEYPKALTVVKERFAKSMEELKTPNFFGTTEDKSNAPEKYENFLRLAESEPSAAAASASSAGGPVTESTAKATLSQAEQLRKAREAMAAKFRESQEGTGAAASSTTKPSVRSGGESPEKEKQATKPAEVTREQKAEIPTQEMTTESATPVPTPYELGAAKAKLAEFDTRLGTRKEPSEHKEVAAAPEPSASSAGGPVAEAQAREVVDAFGRVLQKDLSSLTTAQALADELNMLEQQHNETISKIKGLGFGKLHEADEERYKEKVAELTKLIKTAKERETASSSASAPTKVEPSAAVSSASSAGGAAEKRSLSGSLAAPVSPISKVATPLDPKIAAWNELKAKVDALDLRVNAMVNAYKLTDSMTRESLDANVRFLKNKLSSSEFADLVSERPTRPSISALRALINRYDAKIATIAARRPEATAAAAPVRIDRPVAAPTFRLPERPTVPARAAEAPAHVDRPVVMPTRTAPRREAAAPALVVPVDKLSAEDRKMVTELERSKAKSGSVAGKAVYQQQIDLIKIKAGEKLDDETAAVERKLTDGEKESIAAAKASIKTNKSATAQKASVEKIHKLLAGAARRP